MSIEELRRLLDKYRALPLEAEWLEFKEAKNNYDFDKLGKYFSALSNVIMWPMIMEKRHFT